MVSFDYPKELRNPEIIEQLEAAHGIKLPETYKEIVRKFDGSNVSDGFSGFINPETGLLEFIGFDALIPFENRPEDEDFYPYFDAFGREVRDPNAYMLETNGAGWETIPSGIIVFGVEGGGYMFGFDYRDVLNPVPPIVLLHRDNSEEHYVIQVGKSFDRFLASLVTSSDVEQTMEKWRLGQSEAAVRKWFHEGSRERLQDLIDGSGGW